MIAPNQQPYADNVAYLKDELRRLDWLIWLRVNTLRLQNQSMPETQLARAMYITPQEVKWMLAQDPEDDDDARPEDSAVEEIRAGLMNLSLEIAGRVRSSLEKGVSLALPKLAALFGLSAFELQALVICLAPELRRKYDRLYAYLQDDITRMRPSADLVLELLCESEAERWQRRRFLADTATLLHAGLLEKVNDAQSPSGSSGLAQFLRVEPRICAFLLESRLLNGWPSAHAQVYWPSKDPAVSLAEPELAATLERLVKRHLVEGAGGSSKLVLYLHGPSGSGKLELALNVCRSIGRPLLSLDVDILQGWGADPEKILRMALREGLLEQTGLYLEHADRLLLEACRPLLRTLAEAVREYGWLVFLDGETAWPAAEIFGGCQFQQVAVPAIGAALRFDIWRHSLVGRIADPADASGQLASRYALNAKQIRSAVELAENQNRLHAGQGPLTLEALSAACRQQFQHKLGELAIKIEPRCDWEDIVLPESKLDHLREICSQVRNHDQVFRRWAFEQKLSHGRGLSVLFSGASGTGKTLAAEVLARDLALDLYKIDLSGVVSKYIGETSQNLDCIFGEAEKSGAILFFDEADALFGRRTEVTDAHDRYANIETSYLLQKMDEYDGMVILATNLRENMDEAFTRRMRFIVNFPFPDAPSRLLIWKKLFPPQAPLSAGIDFEFLAQEIQVAGGNIKNIILNAAFLAAEEGSEIQMRHLLHGARREYEKIGRVWNVKPDPAALAK